MQILPGIGNTDTLWSSLQTCWGLAVGPRFCGLWTENSAGKAVWPNFGIAGEDANQEIGVPRSRAMGRL